MELELMIGPIYTLFVGRMYTFCRSDVHIFVGRIALFVGRMCTFSRSDVHF